MKYNMEVPLSELEKEGIQFVCDYFKLTFDDLLMKDRHRPKPQAKAIICFYLLKMGELDRTVYHTLGSAEIRNSGLKYMSSLFQVDHSTINHYVQFMDYTLFTDFRYLMIVLCCKYSAPHIQWEDFRNLGPIQMDETWSKDIVEQPFFDTV